MKRSNIFVAGLLIAVFSVGALYLITRKDGQPTPVALRGTSGYTPYDAFTMLWARKEGGRQMVWVNSGSDAGRLLISKADSSNRPDFAVCTQGVVAGLATRGEEVTIIATLFVSDDAIRPVYRKPRPPLAGSRSLFIPRSSIEFAFDNLLLRENARRSEIRIPTVEKTDFSVITSLLRKPIQERDALDFAILVEPFISNLLTERPGEYEIGDGGIYHMHYCVCVRREDLLSKRSDFVSLLRDFAGIDEELGAIATDGQFRESVWGRKKDGQPELLPVLTTFSRSPLQLQLNAKEVRRLVREEMQYLVERYPDALRMPPNPESCVDASLLREVLPGRVSE